MLIHVLQLLACDATPTATVATPTGTTPAPTPTPTPTPVPATPQPYAPPPDDTPLDEVDPSDWPALCDHLAVPRQADVLDCNGYEVAVPARSRAQGVDSCVQRYGDASTLPGCLGTVGDLSEILTAELTCEFLLHPPQALQDLDTCADEPEPLPIPIDCPVLQLIGPEDGSANMLPTVPVRLALSEVDASASIDVTSAGVPVAGSPIVEGNTVRFVPDVLLEGDTLYRATYTWCGGFERRIVQFTTGDFGDPVDPTALAGDAYVLDLSGPNADWVQPPGIGGLFQSQVEHDPIFVFAAADADALTMVGGLAVPGAAIQDACFSTHEATVPFDANPVVTGIPVTVEFFGAPIGPLNGSTLLASNGTPGPLTVEGLFDTRDFVDVLTPGAGDSGVCDLMLQFGVVCSTCPTGGDFCLHLEIQGVEAVPLANPVVPVLPSDVAANPSCP